MSSLLKRGVLVVLLCYFIGEAATTAGVLSNDILRDDGGPLDKMIREDFADGRSGSLRPNSLEEDADESGTEPPEPSSTERRGNDSVEMMYHQLAHNITKKVYSSYESPGDLDWEKEGFSPDDTWLDKEELASNDVYPRGRNYFKLAKANRTACETCLIGGEIFVIYPRATNITQIRSRCALPGEIYASRSLSVIYHFYLQVQDCARMVPLRAGVVEDLLWLHPFSGYRGLKRKVEPAFLPPWGEASTLLEHVSRLALFPFSKYLIGLAPPQIFNVPRTQVYG